MRELTVNDKNEVKGGVWTPTTTHHDSPDTGPSEAERLAEL